MDERVLSQYGSDTWYSGAPLEELSIPVKAWDGLEITRALQILLGRLGDFGVWEVSLAVWSSRLN